MLITRYFHLLNEQRFSVSLLKRCFHHEFSNKEPSKTANDKIDDNEEKLKQQNFNTKLLQQNKIVTTPSAQQKYKLFRDEDATEIFDVEEERHRYQQKDMTESELAEQFGGLNLTHGVHGVYDVEDLVEVLRKENAEDIFVCTVAKKLKYVDHMVFCTGRSYRHMLSIAEYVRRTYKNMRRKGEILPKIEGEKSRDWMALDLGNIALHIFSAKTREIYDLESLWAIGATYDKEFNKPKDPIVELFEANTRQLIPKNITSQNVEQ